MANILVLHGPNLNLLGSREPHTYGTTTLAELDQKLQVKAQELGHHVDCQQRNSEHELISLIHASSEQSINFMIFNPAAFTHTSAALRDAILGVALPFIEVHISNISQREEFRQYSYFSDIAKGTITGLGTYGYELALMAVHQSLIRG